ncbi:phosphoadenylyl-sulfate reductase [Thiofilum flexile]|uniref:phosphoadenylyl-sulfate reductase n=1 Tax=Thiofilum flexile TaxID=125627 RepID=UPI000366CDF2|nr:phosphoadenylyl-sulfate reductase [Thiofilum flexile]
MTFTCPDLKALNEEFARYELAVALQALRQRFQHKIAFSSSLGLEDQVITAAIFSQHLAIDVFTLDTGRQFPENYSTLAATTKQYGKTIQVLYPNTEMLEQYVSTKGINALYDSVANRKECCAIRKIEPLNRALQGAEVWITGLRAAQSAYRSDMQLFEWDKARNLLKFNPLLHWSLADVRNYITEQGVPYNPLHDQGFPSIGCQPCTRAIAEGEDERAGRWWWETANQECGLHDGTAAVPFKKINLLGISLAETKA